MSQDRAKTVILTHYGRSSGKPYTVKIWFVTVGGDVWLGSMDRERAWVKNLRANGRGQLDFGQGPRSITAKMREDPSDVERFKAAITLKHPLMSRLLRFFFERRSCVFHTCWSDPSD